MKSLLAYDTQRVPLFWIALLRILMGVLILTTWGSNLSKGFYSPDGLEIFFTEVFPQANNPLIWYASFINNGILPIQDLFAHFQLVGEFLLGLFLLIGIFTPYTSAAGVFFILNTFLATFGHDWPWAYFLPIGIMGVTLLARAGRVYGIDGYLLKRFGDRKLPLW